MNLSGRSVTSLAIALLTATSAHAGGERYRIDATLLHAGEPFAKPVVIVRGGEPATIEATGRDAFRFAVTATSVDAEAVRIDADLESAHGSMQPTMIVRAGEPASMTVGDLRIEMRIARLGAPRSP